MVIDSKVFNTQKTDYADTPLILGNQDAGLFDSIHKKYPDIWSLYKKQKAQDWSEDEFPFHTAIQDFETCDKSSYEMMIKTLAWQYEADSVFSRAIAPVFAPFISSSELWAAWQKVSEIEVLHALTYSEIVRNSFKDPKDVLDEILAVQESHDRMSVVGAVFSDGYRASHEYALGLIPNDQDLYNRFMLMVLALYLGERVQFMSSFAITFALCETGKFQPIGKAIQKICQDEFEIHAQLDKVVFQHELKTERGMKFREQCDDKIKAMISEVIESESEWADYLFSEGRSLVGITKELLKSWTLYCAGDVIRTLKVETEYNIPKTNPLKYMEHWINIGLIQPAPQEQQVAMYLLNNLERDDANEQFDVDF